MIVRGRIQAVGGKEQAWDQRALQCGCQQLHPRTLGVSVLSGLEQLTFVGTPVVGVLNGDTHQQRLPVIGGLDVGGEKHRQPGVVGRDQFHGDALKPSVELQQRSEVGLVVNAATDTEQVGEPPAQQRIALVAQLRRQRRVDLGDPSVR